MVVAPSLVPRGAGERVKADRRDALKLARLHRSGDLRQVWVPDGEQEAVRDLTRAREDMKAIELKARQRLSAFLLRHDRLYPGRCRWTQAHHRWLEEQTFDHPVQQVVFQEYVDAAREARHRVAGLEAQIRSALSAWSLRPVAEALISLRGIDVLAAVMVLAELGDLTRFDSPRQLMSFPGLVPSEHSSGSRLRQGAITRTGNGHVRRVPVQAAWNYRFPARKTAHLQRKAASAPAPGCRRSHGRRRNGCGEGQMTSRSFDIDCWIDQVEAALGTLARELPPYLDAYWQDYPRENITKGGRNAPPTPLDDLRMVFAKVRHSRLHLREARFAPLRSALDPARHALLSHPELERIAVTGRLIGENDFYMQIPGSGSTIGASDLIAGLMARAADFPGGDFRVAVSELSAFLSPAGDDEAARVLGDLDEGIDMLLFYDLTVRERIGIEHGMVILPFGEVELYVDGKWVRDLAPAGAHECWSNGCHF